MKTVSVQNAVIEIVSHYTRTGIRHIRLNVKMYNLRIGAIDLESIRLDLEDKYFIEISASERVKWKKCKHIIASVNSAIKAGHNG